MNQRTKGTPPHSTAWFPRIGQLWPDQGIDGGIVRGEKGLPDHHLFVSTSAATINTKVAWGPRDVQVAGADSSLDGRANTIALVGHVQAHPAAAWAASIEADGHADWYLPSRRELRLLWVNVPELFASGWYWSSTQYSAHYAWGQYFVDGYQGNYDK